MQQALAVQLKKAALPMMFGWASVDCPTVSAILAPANAPLTMSVYLAYLQDRVKAMLDREDQPTWALLWLTDQLETAGLLSQRPNLRDPDEALNSLIFSNPALHEHLSSLGAFPGRVTVSKDSQRARQLVREISLEQWISALTEGLDEHLM